MPACETCGLWHRGECLYERTERNSVAVAPAPNVSTESAPPPTDEQVASAIAIADVAKATETEALQAIEEVIAICGCGRPASHRGQCRFRALEVSRRKHQLRESFAEVKQAVTESGKEFGANDDLVCAALVLVAGLWTRDIWEISDLVGKVPVLLHNFRARCINQQLWTPPGGVILGEFEREDFRDLEFWLYAMVAEGKLELVAPGEFKLAAPATEQNQSSQHGPNL